MGRSKVLSLLPPTDKKSSGMSDILYTYNGPALHAPPKIAPSPGDRWTHHLEQPAGRDICPVCQPSVSV